MTVQTMRLHLRSIGAMSAVVVLDVGKTNVKLTVADARRAPRREPVDGPTPSGPGRPTAITTSAPLEDWLLDGLRDLGRRHAIEAIVTSRPRLGRRAGRRRRAGPADDRLRAARAAGGRRRLCAEIAGSFRERGSPIMLGAAHLARQMLWLERDWPETFARAAAFLATPQYWAWRLSRRRGLRGHEPRRAIASLVRRPTRDPAALVARAELGPADAAARARPGRRSGR